MPVSKTKKCEDCKRVISISNFYNTNSVFADGKASVCKSCIKKMLNYNDMNTIYEALQLLNAPFLYNYWESAKLKNETDPWNVYIRMANSKMNEFKNKTYKDSEFKSLNKHNNNNDDEQVSEAIIDKWGEGYGNNLYKMFEKKYYLLKNNYPEKTAMHTEALLNYIRYRCKEEESTALGDVSAAKGWGALAKDAATAAKINPSQLSKSDLTDGLSTFGELIRATEQAVDIIEILPKFKSKPQDRVDFTLWCYINYIRDLKGLPPCSYEDIYEFYEERKKEYSKHGSNSEIFEEESTDDKEETNEEEE